MYILHTGAKFILIKARERKVETDAHISRDLFSGVVVTNFANEISHELEVAAGEVEALEVGTFHC
jgi:hypothetical protein